MTEQLKGKLYIVATPIGNLADISFRAIETLKSADVIAAEDTRRTRKLLSYYDVHTPLISFRVHNKVYQGRKLMERLLSGENVALCSDAGMPLISDPGEDFVQACIEKEIPVTVIPGANAATSALVLSGFSVKSFLYLGFIPRKSKKKHEFLNNLRNLEHTLIFYESPKRIVELLKDLNECLGSRKACVARELTKVHEEVIRGTLDELIKLMDGREWKGEFTVVVEGATPPENKNYFNVTDVVAEVKKLILEGIPRNRAMKKTAEKYKMSKRAIYQIYLDYGL